MSATGSLVLGSLPSAYARIAVGPPDYAPDRRHLISLADGLKDRVDRAEVFRRGYLDEPYTQDEPLIDLEITDLVERIYETMARDDPGGDG